MRLEDNETIFTLALFALVLGAVLTLLCGCVNTAAGWRGADGSQFDFKRRAVLYPFRTGGLEFDTVTGLLTILDYKTDGGAAIVEGAACGAVKGVR
jgi:hypothetical protein